MGNFGLFHKIYRSDTNQEVQNSRESKGMVRMFFRWEKLGNMRIGREKENHILNKWEWQFECCVIAAMWEFYVGWDKEKNTGTSAVTIFWMWCRNSLLSFKLWRTKGLVVARLRPRLIWLAAQWYLQTGCTVWDFQQGIDCNYVGRWMNLVCSGHWITFRKICSRFSGWNWGSAWNTRTVESFDGVMDLFAGITLLSLFLAV